MPSLQALLILFLAGMVFMHALRARKLFAQGSVIMDNMLQNILRLMKHNADTMGALTELDQAYTDLRKAAFWLAEHPKDTELPDWVDRAVNNNVAKQLKQDLLDKFTEELQEVTGE